MDSDEVAAELRELHNLIALEEDKFRKYKIEVEL